MPTHLEMVFDFTADDLVANRDGRLSKDQQAERDDELPSLKQSVMGCTAAQIALPVMIAVNWLTGAILDQDIMPFISIGVFVIISVHFMLRTQRKRLKFLQKGELLRSPVLRKSQFMQIGTTDYSSFYIQTEYLNICLSVRQYDGIERAADYQFYVWAHGNETPSEILAVEQLNGHSAQCTDLEYAFKFSDEDLHANKEGQFTLHQVCEHYNYHMIPRDTHYVAIFDYSFLTLVMIWAVIRGQLDIVIIYGLIFAMMLFIGGYLYRNAFQARRKSRDVLDFGQPSVATGIHRVDFTEGEGLQGKMYYVDDEDGMRFELSVAQWQVLDEDASYTFYYLPTTNIEDPHTILSVEKQELA